MPYAGTTWGQLKAALFTRLGDSVFYTDDATLYSEVAGYLTEALRVWGAAAHRWKDRAVASLTTNSSWYDLTTLTTLPASLLAYSVLDRHLLAEIQYHFLEPVAFSTWVGTEQFTLPEITAALQRRRDQFLLETGVHLKRTLLASGPPAAEGRFELPASGGKPVMEVRRVAWSDVGGVYKNLWREDEKAADAFAGGWAVNPATTPEAFSVTVTPSLTLQFIPPPADVGQIELVATYAGATLDPSTGVLLGVPDNLAWIVKYGAMGDLLGKEGPARDAGRAMYCERRWREGIDLARMYGTVLAARVNGQPVEIVPVQSMDAMTPGWQNAAAGTPAEIGIAGLNLIACTKPNDTHSLTLDVLRSAPIPSSDGAALQLGPEELDAILDYAQHIAAFKQGGTEFEVTTRHYENLIRLAAVSNERIRACASFANVFFDQTQDEEEYRPRRRAGDLLKV
jgi:hypothetical protein